MSIETCTRLYEVSFILKVFRLAEFLMLKSDLLHSDKAEEKK